MLKWILLVCLVGLAYGHPGVYDEYTYSDEDKEEGGMYIYYDDDESQEEDIDDELLKKITDEIANTSYEDEKPQRGSKGMKKNKRTKRSAEEDPSPDEHEAVDLTSRKKKKFSIKVSKGGLKLKVKPSVIIKEVSKAHQKPLNKNQRDQIKGGFMGWQYSMLEDNSCTCKEDNKCTCCSSASANSGVSVCADFVAEPKRAQVSVDIGAQRQVRITIAENSKSMGCENLNLLKDICLYSYGFTVSDKGYKACAIITNNVKDPKAGVLKCINYNDGKVSISDE